MFDPDRDDASSLPHSESGIDSDVKIEQLLLAGLDYYFKAQYERAISVWTCVQFLDQGHARARAYIERARTALAERQRESDELLHTGVAAFNRGDVGAARELLTSAVERGDPHDEALAFLDRLRRLDVVTGTPAEPVSRSRSVRRARRAPTATARGAAVRFVRVWPVVLLLGVGAGGLYLAASWDRVESVLLLDRIQPRSEVVSAQDELLPVPSASEVALSRARVLFEQGQLRDTLRALDAVKTGDPLKSETGLLRSTVQRALLAGSGESSTEAEGKGVMAQR